VSNPCGIIVFGLNGCGKTTLARELARILNYVHMDAEDYYFRESEIPYTDVRSHDEVIRLMLADIKKHRGFVISSVTGDYGDEIMSMYSLAVYITVPTEVRINRVEQREHERHGKRIREDGDMYEQHKKFITFVASRSLAPVEQWAETLACPVICIDGTTDWRTNAAKIRVALDSRCCENYL